MQYIAKLRVVESDFCFHDARSWMREIEAPSNFCLSYFVNEFFL